MKQNRSRPKPKTSRLIGSRHSNQQKVRFNIHDELTTERDIAREDFLRALRRRKPQVLALLADVVLPQYRTACAAKTNYLPLSWGQLGLATNDEQEGQHRDAFDNLQTALLAWAEYSGLAWITGRDRAREYFLRVVKRQKNVLPVMLPHPELVNPWCLDVAVQTLGCWCYFPVEGERDWVYSVRVHDFRSKGLKDYWPKLKGDRAVSMLEHPFRFEFPGWHPAEDTWKSYKKRVIELVATDLETYRKEELSDWQEDYQGEGEEETLAAMSKLARSRAQLLGPFDAIEKRSPSHFDWLVDYQCEGKTLAAISRDYGGREGLSERSVREAIRSTAKLLDLTLRPTSRGRPRSTPSVTKNRG